MRGLALLALALFAPGCMALRSHESKVAGLADPDPEERFNCLLGLQSEMDDPARAAELCDLALKAAEDDLRPRETSPSLPVRLVALRTLAKLGKAGVRTKDVAQKLADHASRKGEPDLDPKTHIERSAFWCRIESLEGLAGLVEGPQNVVPDETVRSQVYEALVAALPPKNEPDRDVRITAAREIALLHPDDPAVLRELVEALSDEAPDVRYHAQRALVAITGGDHGPTKTDWDIWVRRNSPSEGHK